MLENKENKINEEEVLKRLHAEYNRILDEQRLIDICDPYYAKLDISIAAIAIVMRMLAVKYGVNDIDIP